MIPKEQHKTTVTIYVINAPNTVIQTEKPGTWTQNQWHAVMKGMDWSGAQVMLGATNHINMSNRDGTETLSREQNDRRGIDAIQGIGEITDESPERRVSSSKTNKKLLVRTNPLSNQKKPLTQAVREIEPLEHSVNI